MDTHTLKAEAVTRAHMQRVSALLNEAAIRLLKKANAHDASKLDEAELGPLAAMQATIEQYGHVEYGTPEYDKRKEALGPMLRHHYANNRHHPEHFGELGIQGMDLFDLLEMFLDWKAASERDENSAMNLNTVCDRYDVPQALKVIMGNTASTLGFKYK